jgi:hypothetical protein
VLLPLVPGVRVRPGDRASCIHRSAGAASSPLVNLAAMPDEHVFTVAGAAAVPATPITLAEAGFTERTHLQEWVIAHPEMLGAGVMIVTLEFDQWRSSAGSQERDRLDVLGLDHNGRLVVAELKRDVAPDTVEMQALKYAAMASRFTPETLAAQHAKYLSGATSPRRMKRHENSLRLTARTACFQST